MHCEATTNTDQSGAHLTTGISAPVQRTRDMETKSSRQLTCVVAVLLVVALVPSARGKCRSDDDCVLQCPTDTDKGVCRRQICSCLPSPALSAANDLRGHPCAGDQDCVKFCDYFKCPVAKCEKGLCSCTCPR